MGRRGVSPEDEKKWVFNRLAAVYRHRPGYPETLVDRLEALAGPRGRVAELGAGIGHLARPLARRGLRVSAVEPARAMLEELRRLAREEGLAVEPVLATAERTGLPAGAFELVLFADAAHWVDPELAGSEAARLLTASGSCAVVEAELGHTPFLDELQAALARANPRARRPSAQGMGQLLTLARPGVPLRIERFSHQVTLAEDALEGTLRSLSFVGPALAPKVLAQVLEEARELARRHGGAVWRRELTLTWAGPSPRD